MLNITLQDIACKTPQHVWRSIERHPEVRKEVAEIIKKVNRATSAKINAQTLRHLYEGKDIEGNIHLLCSFLVEAYRSIKFEFGHWCNFCPS